MASGELLNSISVEAILAMRDDIFRVIENKREIVGGDNSETVDLGLNGLSKEAFFKNKKTGAIVSFTYTTVEKIINSDIDLLLVAKSYDENGNYSTDIPTKVNPPLLLKSLKKEDRDIFNEDEAIVVQFRPDIQTKFPLVS